MQNFNQGKKENRGGLARLNPAERVRQSRNLTGFTVIELLIVSSIIVILASVLVLNHREAADILKLERSASKLMQDIRRASSMALSAREFPEELGGVGGGPCPGLYDDPPQFISSYGIYFNKRPLGGGNNDYDIILYGDCNHNKKYEPNNSPDWLIEEIILEPGIKIVDITTDPSQGQSSTGINFSPPSPTIYLGQGDGGTELNYIEITIASEKYPTKERIIRINKAGLVSIQ